MPKKILIIILFIVAIGAGLGYVFGYNIGFEKAVRNTTSTPEAQTTSEGECPADMTLAQTEGPYYKTGSPEKNDFSTDGATGEILILKGYVYDQNCQPVSRSKLDFWQADGEGNYDNAGYKLRGHLFTDDKGFYRLQTVMPGDYPGRTPHIHVKVNAPNQSQVLTSQIYFPNDSNQNDSIFDQTLLSEVSRDNDSINANFSFKINTN